MAALENFFSAWGETDEAQRYELIASAIAPEGHYIDPMTPEPLVGPDAAASYVRAFTENAPGATARVAAQQERHGMVRATIAFEMPGGQVQLGQYFVEFTPSGTVARMVGFVGLGEPES